MSGTLEFVVVLAVLYIFECLRLARPGELILDHGVLRKPIFYPNDRWGWLLLNPFKPFGLVFSMKPGAYAFDSRGVIVHPDGFVAYEDCVEPQLRGTSVTFRSRKRIEFHSAVEAHEFMRVLPAVLAAATERRSLVLRTIAETRFNTEAIHREVAELRRKWRGLLRLSKTQMALGFVLLPVFSAWFGLSWALLGLLPVVLGASVAAALLYRKYATQTSRSEYYENILKLIFYPVSVFRAVDLVSYDSLASYDPIAIALACGNKDAARQLALREYLDLRFRGSIADNDFRRSRLALLEWIDAREKLGLGDALAVPAPADHRSRSYCPVCRAQYVLTSGFCADCPEVVLQQLRPEQ